MAARREQAQYNLVSIGTKLDGLCESMLALGADFKDKHRENTDRRHDQDGKIDRNGNDIHNLNSRIVLLEAGQVAILGANGMMEDFKKGSRAVEGKIEQVRTEMEVKISIIDSKVDKISVALGGVKLAIIILTGLLGSLGTAAAIYAAFRH